MQPNSPSNSPYQPVPPPQPHEYDFLVNAQKPPKRSFKLPGSSSLPLRIAVVAGGLLILIIIFSIIKSALSGGGNTQALITVGQDQQQIIHITDAITQGDQQTTLSGTNQNFAVTANAALTSAQAQLLAYMKTNGHKVSTKTLSMRVSANLDEQLKTAIANTTYDSTFKSVMQGQLSDYEQALRTAYKQTSGPKGRKLLSDQFNGAQLLLQQLNTPAN
jgi:hypothetical protein